MLRYLSAEKDRAELVRCSCWFHDRWTTSTSRAVFKNTAMINSLISMLFAHQSMDDRWMMTTTITFVYYATQNINSIRLNHQWRRDWGMIVTALVTFGYSAGTKGSSEALEIVKKPHNWCQCSLPELHLTILFWEEKTDSFLTIRRKHDARTPSNICSFHFVVISDELAKKGSLKDVININGLDP